MKHKLFQPFILGFILLTMSLSSCNLRERKIYKIVPGDAAFVGSFSPGKLMEKAGTKDLEFINKALSENVFSKYLFENPGMSGIDVNSNSCIFMSGTDQKYLGVVMPIKNRKVFELFLDNMGKQFHDEFTKEQGENYTFSKRGNQVMGWNKNTLMYLRQIKGQDGTPIEDKLAGFFSLEDEKCILSEQDFKSFLTEQKDFNLWLTSNQIGSFTETNPGMLNMLGAINNNYAHIFLEFQDGAVVLSSNLKFNGDFKKNFDKFNIIDLNAEKDILKMLPSEDLILAGNFRLNSEKLISIIEFFNSGNQQFLQEFEKETGSKPEEVLKSLQGSLAFSINGILSVDPDPNAKSFEKPRKEKMPVMLAAMQINDEKLFKDFLSLVKLKESVIEKDGYYIVKSEGLPFYLLFKNNVILLSNKENYIIEINSSGEVKNNLRSSDISKSLINNPICLYMNIDRDSYSDKVRKYMNEDINENIAKGMENFGASLKSLTINGSIENAEIRIELKDKSVNSLHAILKSLDRLL